MLVYLLSLLTLTSASFLPKCKTIPGTEAWPSEDQWTSLNTSLSGHLIKVSPPGAVCHPSQSTFNPTTCPAVQAGWKTSAWHTEDPVSSIQDNWNNDTCLPDSNAPCSGAGYPLYVVNATSAMDVKTGVDFARKHDIRLIVKGTGHDYLGRSSGSNSLSIWTRHMRGLSFHNSFRPRGCSTTINVHAITAAAGTQMGELNEQAYLRNLTIVSGGAETVGVGGYLSGGGHSILTPTFGMAADQVLEMEVVTPDGRIRKINECQNRDLFWAFRGGGGSTFGIITSVTIQAHLSFRHISTTAYIATSAGNPNFWSAIAKLISHFPALDALGISAYTFIRPNVTSPEMNITEPIDAYAGIFHLPAFSPENTTESLREALTVVFEKALAAYPGEFLSLVPPPVEYSQFWEWWRDNNGPLNGGGDVIVGSRLLGKKELMTDTATLAKALKAAGAVPGLDLYLVGPGGNGPRKVVRRGGGSVVSSIWKDVLVHTVIGVTWPAFDKDTELRQKSLLTNKYVEALRQLAPDSHAYVNEADPNEPNFQRTFWGDNYERLLAIKRKYDPTDVLWCHPCVGNEGWKVVDNVLCRVPHGFEL